MSGTYTEPSETDDLVGIVRAIGEQERALMASVLLDARTLPMVRETFTATGLRSDASRLLWQAIEDVADSGVDPDFVTVRGELLRSGNLEQAGGLSAITGLVDGYTRSPNASSYGLRLRELHGRLDGVRIAERIRSAATNGVSVAELGTIFGREASALTRALPAPEIASAVRLADVEPEVAEFVVRDLLPRTGVVWIYGAANVGKSFQLLGLVTELLAATEPVGVFGNPELRALGFLRRLVWVSAEETAGRMRARYDMVLGGRGLKAVDVRGTLLFVWPFAERARFTMDKAEPLLDAVGGNVDAVVFDSWTSLAPAMYEGRSVEWDKDNYATRALVNVLRDVAARRRVLFIVVDHEGKNAEAGARGPSEKRNAADTVIHVERIRPERRYRFTIEKQRDGRAPWSFVVTMDFGQDAVRIRHEQRDVVTVQGSQATVLAFLTGAGCGSVAAIVKGTDLARSTVQSALTKLEGLGRAELSDEKDSKGSPVWMVPTGAEEVPNNA